ncbi:MFS transporter [Nocardioides aurantiacus]|uniref:MFS transporter n=1 Tax=Nocardioides aurantiacus TaxID=86796 RepID=A0A3N2CUU4_9ACTN|nr:MFS transporter [Nocardioides aurantiacus]ROR91243.1 MFS transporter [Nocardioides aurantiacus]
MGSGASRGLERRLLAWQALDEAMPVFPVYALLFADAGLSVGQISVLLALWSVVGIVLEVPSGAWADTVSRRGLLALGAVVYAAAFATWVLLPTFTGFAAGFALWGLSGALTSGTFQALAYDELAARGARHRYAHVIGVGQALAVAAMTVTTLLAAPLLAVGGYDLVGWASVGVCLVQLAVVARLPAAPPVVSAVALEDADDPDDVELEPLGPPRQDGAWTRWRTALRTGLGEATTSALVRGAVLASATVLALQVLDEYFGLLFREQGAALVVVPLLVGLVGAGEAVGALVATRATGWSPRRAGSVVAVAGILVGAAALAGDALVAALALTVGYGLVQLSVVLAEVRLQDSIEHDARATVVSTSNVLAELLSVAAYVGFALAPADGVARPVLVLAAVTVVLGVLVARWLPPAVPAAPARSGR